MASTTASTSSAKPFQSMPRSVGGGESPWPRRSGANGREAGEVAGQRRPHHAVEAGGVASRIGSARSSAPAGSSCQLVDGELDLVGGRDRREAGRSAQGCAVVDAWRGGSHRSILTPSRAGPDLPAVERPGDEQVAQHGDGRRVDDERALHEQLARAGRPGRRSTAASAWWFAGRDDGGVDERHPAEVAGQRAPGALGQVVGPLGGVGQVVLAGHEHEGPGRADHQPGVVASADGPARRQCIEHAVEARAGCQRGEAHGWLSAGRAWVFRPTFWVEWPTTRRSRLAR